MHRPDHYILTLHTPWSYVMLMKLGINKTESRSDFPCKGFFPEEKEKSAELLFVKEELSLVLLGWLKFSGILFKCYIPEFHRLCSEFVELNPWAGAEVGVWGGASKAPSPHRL